MLLNRIGERRPELAERLQRLHAESPERFHELLLGALMLRLDDVLAEAEAEPRPERPAPPGGLLPPSRPARPQDAQAAEFRELHEKHARLEGESRALAERLRDTPEAQREELEARLRELVVQQFEVRTALRRLELNRIQADLQRLQSAVERLQGELETRDRERQSVIDRRLNQLLGRDKTGW